MNKSRAALEKYQSIYVELGFERGALFELVRERYGAVEVLYPGCSVHITPAFSFPHVCFVDRSTEAAEFFSQQGFLLEFISRQRTYRRRPYIQFIPQDFTQPLPLLENQFDLLLALFTGGVSKACKSYLKYGGLLLTNNHQDDAVEASREKDLRLIAVIEQRKGKLQLREASPDEEITPKNPPKRYLRQSNRGVDYVETERYYLFQKLAKKGLSQISKTL